MQRGEFFMTEITIRAAGRFLRYGWPLLLLPLMGCSSAGTVTGKVTFQGKPLPAGTVIFVPEKGGGAFRSEIFNGDYKVEKVPSGPVKIAVTTPSSSTPPMDYIMKMRPPAEVLQKVAPGKSPEDFTKQPPPQTEPIPKKFSDPDTSGLTYTVKGGSQVFDINLPDK
jgi:hypothetical protein